MYSYGFDVNARGPNQLANRPAMVDQPYGSGRALLLGTNPYYRAWIDGEERLAANAILYPLGAPIGPAATTTQVAAAAEPAAAPVPEAKLPAVAPQADRSGRNTIRDVRITVKRNQAAKLRKAVKRAKLSRKLRGKVRYVHTRRTTTLVIRNVRTSDPHDRKDWVIRIMDGLAGSKVRAIRAQV
jgi:hypothetical protein